MDFKVWSSLTDDSFIVRAEGEFKVNDLFYCYLLCYGKVIQRVEAWQANPEFRWKLTEPGLYSAQLHLKRNQKNIIRYSIPLQFASKYEKQKFISEILNKEIHGFPRINAYTPKYPYQNLFILHSNKKLDCALTETVCTSHGLQAELFFNGHLCVASDRKLKSRGEIRYGISGMFFKQGSLFVGDDDIGPEAALPFHDIGSYAFVEALENEVNFATDYFGVNKLYLFRFDGISTVSNNYHLLLLILKAFGIELSINKKRAIANFSFVSIQPFHQAFCRQTDIDFVEIVPAGQSVSITPDGLMLNPTPLLSDLENTDQLDDEGYLRLAEIAKEEVIGNVRAALDHPRFEHVIVDLSGGMDSRTVFAAVSLLPQYRDKVKIHSHFSAAEPLDLDVALSLAKLYGYDYDDLPEERAFRFGETPWDAAWSYNLGQYFSYTPNPLVSRINNAIRLVGFYGEICARPYYSRNYLNSELDVSDSEFFVEHYLGRFNHLSITSRDTKCLEALHDYFLEEIKSLPGNTALGSVHI